MGKSRTEDILENMLGASNPLPEPQSREESLLQQILEAGGGGGSSTLSGLSDVGISSATNGQVLKYNSTTEKWENANESGGSSYSETTLYNTFTAFSANADITLSDDADKYDEIQIYFCYNETGDGNYYTHRRVERVSKSTVLWSISERQETGNDRGILDMIGSFQDSGIYCSWRVYFTNKTTLHCVGKTDRTWSADKLGIEKIVGVKY